MTDKEKYIKEVNQQLKLETPDISPSAAEQYFEAFRRLFKNFAQEFANTASEGERKASILNICDSNYLYAIQLKLGIGLPDDLKEVAYDFDNPEYPGYEYITQKVLGKAYMLQRSAQLLQRHKSSISW